MNHSIRPRSKSHKHVKQGDQSLILMSLQRICNATTSLDLSDYILHPKLLGVNHGIGIANKINRINDAVLTNEG